MVLYAERLTLQSRNLFDSFGFVVDTKKVYLFVAEVRLRVKLGIARLIGEHSSNQVKRKVKKIYKTYSTGLKEILDKEIALIVNRVDRHDYVMECWEAYKLLIFEQGFDIINDLTSLSLAEADKLSVAYNRLRQDVSSKSIQLAVGLSVQPLTLFSARSRVSSYVSVNQRAC
jgi:hypothetical protein